MAMHDDFDLANKRARHLQAKVPKVVGAHYDRRMERIVLRLSSGLDISFSPRDAQGLENAKASQLDEIEISPSGFGIHFPRLDADLYVPSILEGFLGSRKWMAASLGAAGGKSTSKAKRIASRRNGKLGGRPRRLAKV